MPSLSVAKSSNASFTPSYTPVVLVTGATSGLGQSVIETLAKSLHGRGHFIFVGRRKSAADDIIGSLPKPTNDSGPDGVKYTYEFIPCDISLMAEVNELAADLSKRLTKLNFLVHSAGTAGFGKRNETTEGIDLVMTGRYYAKFALTYGLLPLLQKAVELGEDAKVMATLGAGSTLTGDIILDDLGLKKTYGGLKAMKQTIAYTDVIFAEFARRYPKITFLHACPGMVRTQAADPFRSRAPLHLRLILFFFYPILYFIFISREDCGEYMTYALLDAQAGFQRYYQYGDDVGMQNFPKNGDEATDALWKHSVEVTKVSIRAEDERRSP